MRITTVNLNGIRAAMKRDMKQWLEYEEPALLLLQEVRADPQIVTDLLGDQWRTIVVPCRIKGRAGVAIAVHRDRADLLHCENINGTDPMDPRTYLYEDENDVDSGRWVEAHIETPAGSTLKVVSAYFHSGEKDTPKQEAKMAHMPRISTRMSELLTQESHALVAGDFNIVRSRADIKNWTPNHNKSAGVLDEEIAFLEQWVHEGWHDMMRDLAGDVQGPYTWWSWRGKAFDNDSGWRIDYQYVTPQLAECARSFFIGRAQSYDQRFSDHAPLSIDYAL
ncbi:MULTISPECIES: exodeoxyribonuclease III [unclassified Schaalia]|uniref:exodeoxyribonuclease III n=1 Tax=unclassified Schaalia TaxID=2691889 RepID=UPI001E5C4742|nr:MULTISPECIES: exodeoxyribonuclease III [unclassified Schaalia]MCD4549777.1 endonuclease/exonuclease/phosphatase family protein [Schaalia sp. lx-260]MCD4556793.1 endonuclease/exonuclease/phosphatase family protein [Schaalia sp. lx-100]